MAVSKMFLNKISLELIFFIVTIICIHSEAAVPVFTTPGSSGRTVPVSETLPAGSSVYRAVAVDADGDILVYSLTSQIPASPQRFSIDSKTGVITTLSTFDFDGPDAISEYSISIRVTDGTSNIQTTLVMQIEDENDNSPVFSHYQVIRQRTKPGYVVADIKAIDADSASNGLVTYKITGGNKEGAFGIDSENGVLYTMYELDSGDLYNLVIEARDYGATPRSSTMTMTLTLAGHLDNGTEQNKSHISAFIISYGLLLIISKLI
ncbi:protein dachsous-like [Ruditapes philippinarum]|uniref:protein dachsous-like n=1 Tax=Ruditapes philippinarum TaxID=129788 RepID=UPI00295A724F|nr:protein dachsous-like [Ruditapes philippinarum]